MNPPTRRRNHMIWIGPVVTVVGLVSYFYVFSRFPALRDFPWVNLPLVLFGGVLSGLGAWRAFGHSRTFRGKWLAPLSLAFSLFIAAFFVLYIFKISYAVPAASEVSLNLVEAPEFALSSSRGDTVRLSDFRGRKVALVFYRGFW